MHIRNGGPTYTFLEPLSTEKLVEDLVLLHMRLVSLVMVYQNGQVYLGDEGELAPP